MVHIPPRMTAQTCARPHEARCGAAQHTIGLLLLLGHVELEAVAHDIDGHADARILLHALIVACVQMSQQAQWP
jgi:hypothetical protein